MKWTQVDLDKKHVLIKAEQSKSKHPIPVPLNKRALELIKAQIGETPTYVFTYQGQPVT